MSALGGSPRLMGNFWRNASRSAPDCAAAGAIAERSTIIVNAVTREMMPTSRCMKFLQKTAVEKTLRNSEVVGLLLSVDAHEVRAIVRAAFPRPFRRRRIRTERPLD